MLTSNLNGVRVYAEECFDRKADYRCPECGEHMILAKGSCKIPHFKHEAHTACEYSGETMDHLRAKAWIYKNLKRRPDVEIVEAECTRFEGIRPDVAFLKNGKWIGFEIQHSGITAAEIKDRIDKYEESGVWYLWVATQKTYEKFKEVIFDIEPEVKLSKQNVYFHHIHGSLVCFTGNSLVAFMLENAVREREGYNYYDGFTGETWEETLKTVFVPTAFCRVYIKDFNTKLYRFYKYSVRISPTEGWDDFDFFGTTGGSYAS